jgi:hypothetical protein
LFDDPPSDDGAEGLTAGMPQRRGICWSHATTVGNIAVASAMLRGEFERDLVACDISAAGKYRNGAARWWCRTHQAYWGVKADLAAFDRARGKVCGAAARPLKLVLDPLVLDMKRCASVRICGAGDGLRVLAAGSIDALLPAIAITGIDAVFTSPDIVQVNVTPPALQALAGARQLGCLDCARCGYPHLDLGSFARNAHRRHYCGNCGCDSTHSKSPIVSNPLFALSEHFAGRLTFEWNP